MQVRTVLLHQPASETTDDFMCNEVHQNTHGLTINLAGISERQMGAYREDTQQEFQHEHWEVAQQ